MIARPVRDKIYLQEKCRFFHCGFTVHRSLLTAYCAKRPERLDLSSSTGLVEGLTVYFLYLLSDFC